jgi:hypothetical protein
VALPNTHVISLAHKFMSGTSIHTSYSSLAHEFMNGTSIHTSYYSLAHEFMSDISIYKAYFLSICKFTKSWTTTLGREGSFSSKKSQRLINDNFTIGIENFEL